MTDTRASYVHIKSILFLEWRDRSKLNRMKCDANIGQIRFGIEYPPIGNPKGQVSLYQYRREVSRTYPDMFIDPSLDLVKNSLCQNGSI